MLYLSQSKLVAREDKDCRFTGKWPEMGADVKNRMASRSCFLAASIAGSVVLGGCAGPADSVQDAVSPAVDDSVSAVATARLALSLDSAGKLTTAATATALDDVLKELSSARSTVLGLSPAGRQDRDLRREAVTVLDGCMSAVITARDSVSSEDGAPSLPDGEQTLASAADRLSGLETRVGGK